jgi:L-histidine Nalpha-methyltransferase
MSSVASVRIHASQFPDKVRRDLLESLRTRRVNHKFHYDSVKQTQQWLALHRAYSPARNDADCRAVYDRAFKAAAARIEAKAAHVIGLGCGGGQKDARLLKLLQTGGREIFYTPCDVSPAMVLVARQTALAIVAEGNCFPFVCDLVTANDLPAVLDSRLPPHASRLITFFGMIPNFEPPIILPKLASLVRPKDFLLFSANLAPGTDYATGMEKVLPQYDNPLTRNWLMTFLLDLGIGHGDGNLRFKIDNCRSRGACLAVAGRRRNEAPTENSAIRNPQSAIDERLLTSSPTRDEIELKRIEANFHFTRRCRVAVESETFDFRPGEIIRLFFSYRYTPDRVRQILARYDLTVCNQWITKSEEEGVFLCGGVS